MSSQRGRALEVHAAGVLRPDGGAPAERADLTALGRACPEPMSAAAFLAFAFHMRREGLARAAAAEAAQARAETCHRHSGMSQSIISN
jgi:hypothetical protein